MKSFNEWSKKYMNEDSTSVRGEIYPLLYQNMGHHIKELIDQILGEQLEKDAGLGLTIAAILEDLAQEYKKIGKESGWEYSKGRPFPWKRPSPKPSTER